MKETTEATILRFPVGVGTIPPPMVTPYARQITVLGHVFYECSLGGGRRCWRCFDYPKTLEVGLRIDSTVVWYAKIGPMIRERSYYTRLTAMKAAVERANDSMFPTGPSHVRQ